MKTCSKCLVEKSLEFFSRKGNKHTSVCKECHNLYYRKYYEANKDFVKGNVRRYKEKNYARIKAEQYGITEEAVLTGMAGSCNVCATAPAEVIDHDHTTGAVRGFLCKKCNTGIGMLGDDLTGVENAVRYLRTVGK